MLVGVLTGNINQQYMLHKMRRAKTPSCRRYGAEEETSVHIRCQCSMLEKVSMQTLEFARMDPEQIKEATLSVIVALIKECWTCKQPPVNLNERYRAMGQ